MKKKMRQKIPKFRSKKGMTLIEILVGVFIIVLVFGATLSAMTNGYASTLYNASANKYAVEGESANEIIMQAIAKQEFTSATDAQTMLNSSDNPIDHAAKTVVSDIVYVDSSDFDSSDAENKYTVVFTGDDTESLVNRNEKLSEADYKKGRKLDEFKVKGMIIKTSVTTASGVVRNISFVPYFDQNGK